MLKWHRKGRWPWVYMLDELTSHPICWLWEGGRIIFLFTFTPPPICSLFLSFVSRFYHPPPFFGGGGGKCSPKYLHHWRGRCVTSTTIIVLRFLHTTCQQCNWITMKVKAGKRNVILCDPTYTGHRSLYLGYWTCRLSASHDRGIFYVNSCLIIRFNLYN